MMSILRTIFGPRRTVESVAKELVWRLAPARATWRDDLLELLQTLSRHRMKVLKVRQTGGNYAYVIAPVTLSEVPRVEDLLSQAERELTDVRIERLKASLHP